MAPVMQYVFAEMRRISDHFTAGSHEWLPYSVIPTFPKLICKQQFVAILSKADKHTSLRYAYSFISKTDGVPETSFLNAQVYIHSAETKA